MQGFKWSCCLVPLCALQAALRQKKKKTVFRAQQEVWRRAQHRIFQLFQEKQQLIKKKKKKSIRGHLSEVWRFTVNNGAQINSRTTLLVINTTYALNLIYQQNSCSDVKGEKNRKKKKNSLTKLCEFYSCSKNIAFLICTTQCFALGESPPALSLKAAEPGSFLSQLRPLDSLKGK